MSRSNWFTGLIALMVLVLLSGCLGMQIKGDEEINAIAEITARRAGNNVAKKNPEKVDYLIKKCDEIIAADIEEATPLLVEALRYASDKYTDDPLLADDIVSLCKLFRVDLNAPEINIDGSEVKTLKVMAAAFKQGLQAQKRVVAVYKG